MIPRILEVEDGHVKVNVQALTIPELKVIIDTYPDNPEPYLKYIYSMTAPDSEYIHIPEDEKSEAIIFDIQATLGDFDSAEPLLEAAILSLREKYEPPMVALAKEMGEEINRFRKLLKSTPLTFDNFKDRMELMKGIDRVSTSYQKVKEEAQKELKVATKGDHELGGYFD